MILYKLKKDIEQKLNALRNQGKSVGFVPTMGALHKGHLSLIEASKKENDVTVCSVFVNPTQFNDVNDFSKYPVTIERDIQQLTEAGADMLFLPSVNEMYPEGTAINEHYELGELETILEGKYRPGHFQGVCAVVHRLFNVVKPHKAYFGQKDYQQCMVIKKLVALKNFPVQIVVHPTVRERSGLALSSRNLRLSERDKEHATILYKTLSYIKQNKNQAPVEALTTEAEQMILNSGFEKIDYVAICHAGTLKLIQNMNQQQQSVVLIAAFIGGVRLIDNMLLH